MIKRQEQRELEAALQMSLIVEEEKKKLSLIEEEEYKIALGLSQSIMNQEGCDDEISLFDPSTLVNKNKAQNQVKAQAQISQNKPKPQPVQQVQNKQFIPSDFSFPQENQTPQVTSVKKDTDFSYL